MTVVCAFRRKGACGRGWQEDGQELAVAGFNADADRVARRQLSPVTARGHAILGLSAMSILDTGELANVARRVFADRSGEQFRITCPRARDGCPSGS